MSKKFTKKILSAVIFATLFSTVPSVFQLVGDNTNEFLLERKDASAFFLYQKVEPEKSVFSKNEELKMISFLDVNEVMDFSWNDILKCNYVETETGYIFIGSQDSSANNVPIGESKVSVWVWEGTKPQSPSNCVIESNIKAEVGHGVIKTQKIISDNFRVQ